VRACLSGLDRNRSTAQGLAQFAVPMAGYIVTFLVTGALPSWAGLFCVPVLFFFISRLALTGHDAGHGSLTANATLNRWLGRVAFLPFLHPYTTWVISHNALHHAYTNLRGKDPMWAPLSKEEFDSLSRIGRALERCYRTPLGVALYYLVEIWWKVLLFPRGVVRARIRNCRTVAFDRLAVLATLVAQCTALLGWQHCLRRTFGLPRASAPVLLTASVLLPFLITCWWAGMVGFLHHTHPRVRWYASAEEWNRFRGQIEGTVHIVVPGLVGWLMAHSLEHTAHHADPKVPFTALPACQRRLEHAYAGIVVQRATLRDCLRILATCKLYEYSRHQWLDYDGSPTTMPSTGDGERRACNRSCRWTC
jgi:omega-6 fatty acid desaturase (delta-12 desaturase)